jgi:hypothetical protein
MFIPALIISMMTSGDFETGPVVQTVLVLLRGGSIDSSFSINSVAFG